MPFRTKSILVEEVGKLSFAEKVLPELPPSHVLVEVVAAAVNPADTYMCQGVYTMQPTLPFTPGMEGSGHVVAVGSEALELKVGDRVAFSVTAADGGIAASTGSWSKHCVVQASLAVRVPNGLDLVSAAAVPIAYLTAHRALFHAANLKPNESVLVRGASGAVGLAAVHLAKHFAGPGRLICGTASSPNGRAGVEARGGVATGHADAEVRKVASQFDVILDLMANENLGGDLELVAPGGQVIVIGSRPGAEPAHVDARQALVKEAKVCGVFLWRQTESERRRAYKDIFEAFVGEDQAAPSVRRFPFRSAEEAHDVVAAQAQGRSRTEGKVLLVHEPAAATR